MWVVLLVLLLLYVVFKGVQATIMGEEEGRGVWRLRGSLVTRQKIVTSNQPQDLKMYVPYITRKTLFYIKKSESY